MPMEGQGPLIFWCLVVLSLYSAAQAVCPDVTDVTSDAQQCRGNNWGKVLNSDAIHSKLQACSHLQETVNCIIGLTDGCDELVANYLAPALYPWAMTSDALQCDTTYKDGQQLTFDDDDCSFHEVYKCHQELFSLMLIVPTQPGEEVDISTLKTWLNAKTLLVEDRKNFCDKYIKGRRESRFTKMSDCADKLKQRCKKALPLHEMIPENPQDAEEDPYTMVKEIKALADKVCTDACNDMSQKEEAAKACRGDDFNTILVDIKADNNRTGNCNNLKLVRGCMVTELNDCPYIVEKAEDELDSDLTEALKTCGLSDQMGSKTARRRDGTTGAAGLTASLTLLMVTLLATVA